MENKIIKIVCPNCGSDAFFLGEKKSYRHYRCQTCRLIFVYPIPDSSSVYNEDYFSGAKGGFGYVDYDVDKEPMISTFNKYLDLFKRFGKERGKLFDIGAATGFFLKIAKKRGFDVSGVEMSDHAAGLARKDGIEVKSGDMMTLNLESEVYDIVTMFDVLEHIPEPFMELKEVRRILKKGGLLVINSPNGESILAKILGVHWHLVMPPEHLFYFSPRNLSLFLKKEGFRLLYSGTIGKRFTLQYIFKMLYKWQGFRIFLVNAKANGILSKIYLPINLHDNFFVIFEKE